MLGVRRYVVVVPHVACASSLFTPLPRPFHMTAALHVAPIPTMREIQSARSTLNFHIAPYASTLLNHTVNLWYAIIRGDTALIAHRIAGIFAQGYYLTTYLTFSAPAKVSDNRRWLQWVAAIVVGIFVWLHFFLPIFNATTQYNTHIAFFGAVTGVGLAASPLATVVRGDASGLARAQRCPRRPRVPVGVGGGARGAAPPPGPAPRGGPAPPPPPPPPHPPPARSAK
jgi:hypothetical protein